jgi:Sec-independent protein secretion pathway component TatC
MIERNPDRVMSIFGHIIELRRRLIASISVALIVPAVSDPKGRSDTDLLCEVWNALEQLIDFFVAPSNKKPATKRPAKDGGAVLLFSYQ